jgi:hypothetical protein
MTQKKKLDPIECFIQSWRQFDDNQSDFLYGVNWNHRFTSAGYYSADVGSRSTMEVSAMVAWCREQFPQGGFSWTGPDPVFWFDSKENAVLFIMRWV